VVDATSSSGRLYIPLVEAMQVLANAFHSTHCNKLAFHQRLHVLHSSTTASLVPCCDVGVHARITAFFRSRTTSQRNELHHHSEQHINEPTCRLMDNITEDGLQSLLEAS